MSRMHLDELLQVSHPNVQALPVVRHRAAELYELTFFTDFHDVDQLADLVRSHADDSRIPADWAWALEEGTWEICANAITHSEWGGGFLAAQHYVQRGEIEYAVGDAGVGIRQSLGGEYPDIADDVAAILKAAMGGGL